jgi:hypothetical protein
MDANVAVIKYCRGAMMRIPLINVMLLKKNSFDRAIREAAETGRAEQRRVTNALISKLLRENLRLRTK